MCVFSIRYVKFIACSPLRIALSPYLSNGRFVVSFTCGAHLQHTVVFLMVIRWAHLLSE